MVRVWSGEQIPTPILTSSLPLFILFLLHSDPYSTGNLELRFADPWKRIIEITIFQRQKKSPHVRHFPPATLVLEMAVPILKAPGIFWFFLLQNPNAHQIPCFKRGGVAFFGGAVEAEVPILSFWAEIFLNFTTVVQQFPCAQYGSEGLST